MAEQETTLYFAGTAGAGKSTLVAACDRWAKQHGLTTTLVNLDPGAEQLPYTPDIDVRDWVKIEEIMAEHGLGPNGAQVAAADMVALNLSEIQEELQAYRADITLVDTPGQIELFVFRQSGKHIIEQLAPGRSVVAYLMDPFLARTPTGFASQLMLGATTYFRFQEPTIFLLSKADRIDGPSLDTIRQWSMDPAALEADVLAEQPSMSREFAAQITRLLEAVGIQNQLVPVSGVDASGLDELYALVQGAVGQSEDATPEQDTFLSGDAENPGDVEMN